MFFMGLLPRFLMWACHQDRREADASAIPIATIVQQAMA
jgi:hypothetical protein